jgi:hypothetical protein
MLMPYVEIHVFWSAGGEPSIGANPLDHKPLSLRSGFLGDVLRHVAAEILEGENRARFRRREQDYCQILQPKEKPPAVAETAKGRPPLGNNRREVKNRTLENHKGAALKSCLTKSAPAGEADKNEAEATSGSGECADMGFNNVEPPRRGGGIKPPLQRHGQDYRGSHMQRRHVGQPTIFTKFLQIG